MLVKIDRKRDLGLFVVLATLCCSWHGDVVRLVFMCPGHCTVDFFVVFVRQHSNVRNSAE